MVDSRRGLKIRLLLSVAWSKRGIILAMLVMGSTPTFFPNSMLDTQGGCLCPLPTGCQQCHPHSMGCWRAPIGFKLSPLWTVGSPSLLAVDRPPWKMQYHPSRKWINQCFGHKACCGYLFPVSFLRNTNGKQFFLRIIQKLFLDHEN